MYRMSTDGRVVGRVGKFSARESGETQSERGGSRSPAHSTSLSPFSEIANMRKFEISYFSDSGIYNISTVESE